MIANYTDHAANERTFLAWVRTGLAVTAFGFFLFKLNVLVDVVDGVNLPHSEVAGTLAAVTARCGGVALVLTGIVIIARSGAGFERTRRAIDRDEVIQVPRSREAPLLSAALVAAVLIVCVYLAVL